MNFFQAVILGIVEGITEFLPISSTAHLILTARLLGLSQTDFLKSFEIIIQLGAILAVVFLYFKSLLKVEILKRLAMAFLPTGLLGLIFYDFVKGTLLESENVVLVSLFLGGIVLILFEWKHLPSQNSIKAMEKIPYHKCFFIGIFQALAMIPGVSRSAATILGGLLANLERKTIVEFSFLLAVPTMLTATVFDFAKNAQQFSSSQMSGLLVGFLVSFVTAILGIKFLLAYVRKKTFIAFGVYRIVLAFSFFLFR